MSSKATKKTTKKTTKKATETVTETQTISDKVKNLISLVYNRRKAINREQDLVRKAIAKRARTAFGKVTNVLPQLREADALRAALLENGFLMTNRDDVTSSNPGMDGYFDELRTNSIVYCGFSCSRPKTYSVRLGADVCVSEYSAYVGIDLDTGKILVGNSDWEEIDLADLVTMCKKPDEDWRVMETNLILPSGKAIVEAVELLVNSAADFLYWITSYATDVAEGRIHG